MLKNDIRFAFLYCNLCDAILFRSEITDNYYDVDTVFGLLIAIDNWEYRTGDKRSLLEMLALPQQEIIAIINKLIPESHETRLRLAGYNDNKKTVVIDAFTNGLENLRKVVGDTYNDALFGNFLETVTKNTMINALKIWCQKFLGTDENALNFWYDPQQEGDEFSIFAYDNQQGGSGMSRELIQRIDDKNSESPFDLAKILRNSLNCDLNMTESVINGILTTYGADLIFDLFKTPSNDQDSIINRDIDKIAKAYNIEIKQERDDLVAFIKHDIKRFLNSEESAAFYKELAGLYNELKLTLSRSPTPIDLVLQLSDDNLYDPRAVRLYRIYSEAKHGDLTEIYTRVSEIIPSCTNACPECIFIDKPYSGDIYNSKNLDKRLLMTLLERMG
jgi:hypothetical protein